MAKSTEERIAELTQQRDALAAALSTHGKCIQCGGTGSYETVVGMDEDGEIQTEEAQCECRGVDPQAILAARLAAERKSLEEKIAQMESFTRGNIGIHWAEENDRLREQRDALAAALEIANRFLLVAESYRLGSTAWNSLPVDRELEMCRLRYELQSAIRNPSAILAARLAEERSKATQTIFQLLFPGKPWYADAPEHQGTEADVFLDALSARLAEERKAGALNELNLWADEGDLDEAVVTRMRRRAAQIERGEEKP